MELCNDCHGCSVKIRWNVKYFMRSWCGGYIVRWKRWIDEKIGYKWCYYLLSKRPPIDRSAWLRDWPFFLRECVTTENICVNAWNDFHAWCVESIKFLRDFVKWPILNPIFAILRQNPNSLCPPFVRISRKMKLNSLLVGLMKTIFRSVKTCLEFEYYLWAWSFTIMNG